MIISAGDERNNSGALYSRFEKDNPWYKGMVIPRYINTGSDMKLYNSVGPNPKVVRMFMAERGIEIDTVEV
ncbi:MAG: hypothetical protein U5O39_13320 [Gammaproteobacteria bacterium]|nr:hypothetical protein [Gammaproteobacteria bacterium]